MDYTTTEYEIVALNKERMTGDMADTIITTLIDNCDNERASASLPVSKEVWAQLVQQFEEQIRHKVRAIR